MELGLEASYGRLWALLAQRHLKKKNLQRLTSLSPSVIAKLGRNETVHLETLLKICTALKCGLGDIVEIVPKENEQMANYMKTAIKSTSVLDIIAALPISAVAWLICFRRKERHSKKKRERGAVAWFAA